MLYTDDIVLLTEDEEGMRSIIGRLEKYLERKGLELNTNKTKIIRCK